MLSPSAPGQDGAGSEAVEFFPTLGGFWAALEIVGNLLPALEPIISGRGHGIRRFFSHSSAPDYLLSYLLQTPRLVCQALSIVKVAWRRQSELPAQNRLLSCRGSTILLL